MWYNICVADIILIFCPFCSPHSGNRKTWLTFTIIKSLRGDKMKITSTLHNHCTMCDGKNTADEMISAAIEAGFTDFGMSCHGYAPFDPEYSMPD